MANKPSDQVVIHHPKNQRQARTNRAHAALLVASDKGWKNGPLPEPKNKGSER